MPRLRKPRALRPGATLAVAAPAFAIDGARLAARTQALRDAGYRVLQNDDVLSACGYLAGDDARRARELMAWIDDPDVDGIVCARGGYGCHRIIADLDAERVRAAAKPLIGFSDVTTLHLWQRRRAGLVGIHAPMLEREAPHSRDEIDRLVCVLAGETPAPFEGVGGGGGRATGRLLGGSLTLLAASLATPWELQTRGAILLFEEIGEKPYAIDRLLSQLRAAGKLDHVAGIGVGHLVGCRDPKRDRPTADEVVAELLAPLGVPLVTGLPFGHQAPNLAWPVGGRAELDGDAGTLRFLEAATEA